MMIHLIAPNEYEDWNESFNLDILKLEWIHDASLTMTHNWIVEKISQAYLLLCYILNKDHFIKAPKWTFGNGKIESKKCEKNIILVIHWVSDSFLGLKWKVAKKVIFFRWNDSFIRFVLSTWWLNQDAKQYSKSLKVRWSYVRLFLKLLRVR